MGRSDPVLVVDDDPGMLRAVDRLLRRHGYESILFSSAEELEQHPDVVNALCIILDIKLNLRSGIELRHQLKARGVLVPVIFITGNETPSVREAALLSGCVAFLTKPFSAHELIESIKQAAGGELLH
ncbi:response regulator transcription factor [Bradyrhizobium sp. WSM471]|uniref:response regulator transcription factor n=1 Tax=Bradyrhizobium sp. WSM471 TaxID=319017 RepID=UPI00024D1A93|nr:MULTISPECIES: response regulator [Bradyrhizobium]EHQ99526.1 response regulator [Bradyrhizobium sp. WSM471]UFW41686.1 response regulator [Bradyrhizobium canariense]